MPTFEAGHVWYYYVLWNVAGFWGAFFLNSFIEWASHKFILHSNKIVKFAYELHDREHHVLFNGMDTYHAQNEDVKKHVAFVPRDYILFLLVTAPIWVVSEFIVGRPIFIGGVLATLAGLQLFNSLHWRYHVPSDTWFQRTRFFRYLKEHHRKHHSDTSCNYNVNFFPIADWVLGTLRK